MFFFRFLKSNHANPEVSETGRATALLHRAQRAPLPNFQPRFPQMRKIARNTKPSLEPFPGLLFTESISSNFCILTSSRKQRNRNTEDWENRSRSPYPCLSNQLPRLLKPKPVGSLQVGTLGKGRTATHYRGKL